MKTRTLSLLAMLTCGSSIAAAEGLTLANNNAWPTWQARLSLTTGAAGRFALADALDLNGASRGAVQGGALLGDYYFRSWNPRWLAPQGGFRATSGLMFGNRTFAMADTVTTMRTASRLNLAIHTTLPAGSDPAIGTVPYLGIGYTGLSLKGGWGFTADLGLTAESPTATQRPGRTLLGTQGVDFALRELRLSPLLQLGVRYSF